MSQPPSKRKKDDSYIDSLLRPQSWNDYIGQDRIKKNLGIILEAARKRGEPVDHLLFYGQAVLSNLEPNTVLFIDEAHRLNHMVEEVLYPAMESRKLNIVIGQGISARTISLDLPPFTLIAATTRVNLLSGPLRSRFGATFQLDYYNIDDIEKILERSAKILGVRVHDEAFSTIASSSRATPRVANRLLKRIRDYSEVHNIPVVTSDVVVTTLEMMGVDALGLEPHDKKLLEVLIRQFNGGPAGVGSLAAALNEDRSVLEEVYEPYLIALGLIHRTPGGRIATIRAYEHLNIAPPPRIL